MLSRLSFLQVEDSESGSGKSAALVFPHAWQAVVDRTPYFAGVLFAAKFDFLRVSYHDFLVKAAVNSVIVTKYVCALNDSASMSKFFVSLSCWSLVPRYVSALSSFDCCLKAMIRRADSRIKCIRSHFWEACRLTLRNAGRFRRICLDWIPKQGLEALFDGARSLRLLSAAGR